LGGAKALILNPKKKHGSGWLIEGERKSESRYKKVFRGGVDRQA